MGVNEMGVHRSGSKEMETIEIGVQRSGSRHEVRNRGFNELGDRVMGVQRWGRPRDEGQRDGMRRGRTQNQRDGCQRWRSVRKKSKDGVQSSEV